MMMRGDRLLIDSPRWRLIPNVPFKCRRMGAEQDMIEAWQAAARELAIRVRGPIQVEGREFPILVEQFGSPKGTLPLLLGDHGRHKIAERAGYFVSLLNPEIYCTFERPRFEDTLNDWQWSGDDAPPDWYTGQPWGEDNWQR